MMLSEAVELLKSVAPNLAFERPYAEAFRVVLAEVTRVTTLVKCEGCDRGVRWRNAVKGLCPDCAAAAIDQLTAERDMAIRRQISYGGDPGGKDRWLVDSYRLEADEKRGPFRSEEAAIASVLAWVRWSIDPADNPGGTTEDEEASTP